MNETIVSHKIVSHKVKTATEIVKAVGQRPRSTKVIMCHGTFDIVHPGHVRHLLYAKSKGDILIASLTADAPDESDHVPWHLRYRASRSRTTSALCQEQGRYLDR